MNNLVQNCKFCLNSLLYDTTMTWILCRIILFIRVFYFEQLLFCWRSILNVCSTSVVSFLEEIDNLSFIFGAYNLYWYWCFHFFNNEYFKLFVQAYSIKRLIVVPSLIWAILPSLQSRYNMQIQNSLKLLVVSGEVFPLSLWDVLSNLLQRTSILNLYETTEVKNLESLF